MSEDAPADAFTDAEKLTWEDTFKNHITKDMPGDIVARQGVLVAEIACERRHMGPVRKSWVTKQLQEMGVSDSDIQRAFDYLRHEFAYPMCSCLRFALRRVKGAGCPSCPGT